MSIRQWAEEAAADTVKCNEALARARADHQAAESRQRASDAEHRPQLAPAARRAPRGDDQEQRAEAVEARIAEPE